MLDRHAAHRLAAARLHAVAVGAQCVEVVAELTWIDSTTFSRESNRFERRSTTVWAGSADSSLCASAST